MTELGDVVVTLSPAMNAIKGIQGGLSSMMPKQINHLDRYQICSVNIMMDSNQMSAASVELIVLL